MKFFDLDTQKKSSPYFLIFDIAVETSARLSLHSQRMEYKKSCYSMQLLCELNLLLLRSLQGVSATLTSSDLLLSSKAYALCFAYIQATHLIEQWIHLNLRPIAPPI